MWKYNKYHNQKTEVAGITFDSKKEAERYLELKMMERAGMIKDLELQKRMEIIPKTDKYRAINYIADFSYFDNQTGKSVCEDVKGMRKGTAYQLFKLKQKILYWRYQIEVKEV